MKYHVRVVDLIPQTDSSVVLLCHGSCGLLVSTKHDIRIGDIVELETDGNCKYGRPTWFNHVVLRP